MLTPDELAKLQEHLVPLYQELEDFIIEDIARRLKRQDKSLIWLNGRLRWRMILQSV